MAGSSSSSRSVSTILNDDDKRHSPIKYRVGPLDYHPAVYCKCQEKAALWISWSNDNPDRRYIKCYRARTGGCGLMEWYDGPHDPFVQTLLIDLRNVVWKLKKEKGNIKRQFNEALEMIEDLEGQVAELKEENARLDQFEGGSEYLEGKVQRMDLEIKLMRVLCMVLLGVALFFRFG
ncbi:hypothetical protein EJB05_31535, partial [Eragrostis curvula]